MYFINDGVYGSFNYILFDHIPPTPIIIKTIDNDQLQQSSIWGVTVDSSDVVNYLIFIIIYKIYLKKMNSL